MHTAAPADLQLITVLQSTLGRLPTKRRGSSILDPRTKIQTRPSPKALSKAAKKQNRTEHQGVNLHILGSLIAASAPRVYSKQCLAGNSECVVAVCP